MASDRTLTKEQYAKSDTRWVRYRVFGSDPKANDMDYQFGHDAVYPSEKTAGMAAGRLKKKHSFYETRVVRTPSGKWGFEYRKNWEAVQEERKHPEFYGPTPRASTKRKGNQKRPRLSR